MLARYLRLLLALQFATFAALAVYAFDLSPSSGVLAALAGMLLLPAGITLATYALAWPYYSRASHLSPWQVLRMVCGDFLALVIHFVIISPLESWWMGADRLPGTSRQPGARPPLLLVHGYGCSRAVWWYLRRCLQAAGWTVATINLEPIYTSIDDYLDPLAARIDAVLADTGAERLILVGHSMGGLVARAYLQRYGEAQVAALLTLGTPHQGSRLAYLGCGENARQMRPGSPWLQALARPTVSTWLIYSRHDNYVTPQSNLTLPGIPGQALDSLGHVAMLLSPRVVQAALAALATLCPSAGIADV